MKMGMRGLGNKDTVGCMGVRKNGGMMGCRCGRKCK